MCCSSQGSLALSSSCHWLYNVRLLLTGKKKLDKMPQWHFLGGALASDIGAGRTHQTCGEFHFVVVLLQLVASLWSYARTPLCCVGNNSDGNSNHRSPKARQRNRRQGDLMFNPFKRRHDHWMNSPNDETVSSTLFDLQEG